MRYVQFPSRSDRSASRNPRPLKLGVLQYQETALPFPSKSSSVTAAVLSIIAKNQAVRFVMYRHPEARGPQ